MKILFLADPSPDFLQDLTWAGLAECLGPSSVAEIPPRADYHAPIAPYPFGQGYVPGEPAPERTSTEAAKALARGDFDVLMVGSAKQGPLRDFLRIVGSGRPSPPTVFVDGGDRTELGGDCAELFRDAERQHPFDLVLKRELCAGSVESRLHPFPFSVNPRAFPAMDASERDLPVYFSARPTSEIRIRAARLLRDRFPDIAGDLPDDSATPDGSAAGLGARLIRGLARRVGPARAGRSRYFDLSRVYRRVGQDYLHDLRRARLAISLRGRGFDTFRYWEIPWSGALLVSEELPILIPDNFLPDREAVFVRPDLADLCERVDYYLKHDRERTDI